MLRHKHLIAGEWVGGEDTFSAPYVTGLSPEFATATELHVDNAVKAAEEAFWRYGYSSRAVRANFLDEIANEIEARADEITHYGTLETGLPEARLIGERGRTVGQLRLFARHIEKTDYLDRQHDKALPERTPLPRPDLKLIQRPIGPVAVFGASNFPLAFSVAGGDTASALAAGCPVVVKGHAAHPATGEIVAQAIDAARNSCELHPGVFSLLQSGDFTAGQALVQHPLINAVGFTGSLRGGRALFDLCAQRPEPIPFFGELGSVNPMFLLPAATADRGDDIAKAWASSLTMGAGQFCTNPGLAIVIEGEAADTFTSTAKAALAEIDSQTMLTDGIADAYRSGIARMQTSDGVEAVLANRCEQRSASPHLFSTTADVWLANEALGEEVFGPLGVIVRVRDSTQMLQLARSLKGQLTCTLHLDDADADLAQQLMPIVERKAGRVLANGFPTGVEVADAMVHGGPYPASTNFGASSVGTMAIRRFLRPVSYQSMPESLLPDDLRRD